MPRWIFLASFGLAVAQANRADLASRWEGLQPTVTLRTGSTGPCWSPSRIPTARLSEDGGALRVLDQRRRIRSMRTHMRHLTAATVAALGAGRVLMRVRNLLFSIVALAAVDGAAGLEGGTPGLRAEWRLRLEERGDPPDGCGIRYLGRDQEPMSHRGWLLAAVLLVSGGPLGAEGEFPIGAWFPGMIAGETKTPTPEDRRVWGVRLDSVKAHGFNTIRIPPSAPDLGWATPQQPPFSRRPPQAQHSPHPHRS